MIMAPEADRKNLMVTAVSWTHNGELTFYFGPPLPHAFPNLVLGFSGKQMSLLRQVSRLFRVPNGHLHDQVGFIISANPYASFMHAWIAHGTWRTYRNER